jgi:hypothetical protein
MTLTGSRGPRQNLPSISTYIAPRWCVGFGELVHDSPLNTSAKVPAQEIVCFERAHENRILV